MSDEYIKRVVGYVENSKVDKPKLTYAEQINYMENKMGIKFNIIDKDYAKSFLENNTYFFKIKSYAKNYPKYTNANSNKTGKYCDVEFAYLLELSTLDMYLRKIIINMALDIEHYLKHKILKDSCKNNADNGYDIVSFYLENISDKSLNTIKLKSKNSYCKSLIDSRIDRLSIWNFVELLSFGDFIEFYKFYYVVFETDKDDVLNSLKPVQWLRNAAAHNNCLINHLDNKYSKKFNPNKEIGTYISKIPGISKKMIDTKFKNQRIHDFIVMLYVYNNVISSESIKKHGFLNLQDFFNSRVIEHDNYFKNNELLKSSYRFVKTIIDYFTDLCNNN